MWFIIQIMSERSQRKYYEDMLIVFLIGLPSKVLKITFPILIDMQAVTRICRFLNNTYYFATTALQNMCYISHVFIPIVIKASYALVGIEFIIVVLESE